VKKQGEGHVGNAKTSKESGHNGENWKGRTQKGKQIKEIWPKETGSFSQKKETGTGAGHGR